MFVVPRDTLLGRSDLPFDLNKFLAASPPGGPRACGTDTGDCAERQKDRTENAMIRSPGAGRAEQRQDGELDKPHLLLVSISAAD
jgi:hypothetical protein